MEHDPNLTDQKFPGNPSVSYRTQLPLKVVGEVTVRQSHSPDQLKAMKEGIAKLDTQEIGAIELVITS